MSSTPDPTTHPAPAGRGRRPAPGGRVGRSGAGATAAQAAQRCRTLRLFRKVGVTVLGLAIVGVGLAMLVAPGPGALVIVLGLFVLSLEYEWAARRFESLKDKALAASRATATNPAQLVLAVGSSLALIGGGVIWGTMKDLPASGWTTGGTLIASGVLALGTIAWSVLDVRRRRAAGR